MSSTGKLQIAFVFSIIGGLVILTSGIFLTLWFTMGGLIFSGMMSGFSSVMSGFHEMMGSLGIPFSIMTGLSLIGLISGIFVIVGAIMLYARPLESTLWGVVILVFSLLSLAGAGGFLIGAILGIVGAVLAMS